MIKKIIILALVSLTLASCTTSADSSTVDVQPVANSSVAMETRIDNVLYETPPQNGGNSADVTGGIYGNTYFLLKGYKDTGVGKVKIGSKTFEIKIVIPKADIASSVGTHNFSSTLTSGGYYADLDINGVTPAENVSTVSGFVKVNSYDATTKEIKGSFNFTASNGVDLTVTHTIIGTYDYILQ
ncbi:MAG: hypothetical protein H7239_14070 [Flavobacterium sp.]|nr:hypothetical protein [Flavobacterium sp.]